MLTITFFPNPKTTTSLKPTSSRQTSFTMKLFTLVSLVAAAVALPTEIKRADVQPWIAAVAGDSRGPCPMMNTLANHGYLYVEADMDMQDLSLTLK